MKKRGDKTSLYKRQGDGSFVLFQYETKKPSPCSGKSYIISILFIIFIVNMDNIMQYSIADIIVVKIFSVLKEFASEIKL